MNKYGWKKQLPDQRDLKMFLDIQYGANLPKFVDLRANCSPVADQGQLGSCTANAIGAAFEYDTIKQGESPFFASRLFIYYNERLLEHSVNQDSGAIIRDGFKTINKYGVCSERTVPYNIIDFKKKPSKAAYKEALLHKSLEYRSLDNTNVNELLSCLASGYPFVFGFSVYDSFESDAVAHTGIVPMPSKDEQILGGHAVMAVGYDLDKKVFIVRNSWGRTWGYHGYCYMPFDYLTNRDLADDFWVVTKIS